MADENPIVANIQRGEIGADIGSRYFVLVPTFKNIQSVEKFLGEKFILLTNKIFSTKIVDLSVEQIATILFMTQKEVLTYDQIGTILLKEGSLNALPLISKFLVYALRGASAFDEAGEVKKEETGNAAAETSKT